ncbi:MAG: YceD family protein [Pseudomonadota bacterium]
MSLDPTQKLDISHLFRDKASFEGSLPLVSMSRIQDMLENDSGDIIYQIQFTDDDRGRQLINITINAEIQVLCQRCLKITKMKIERSSSLVIVINATELKPLDDDHEPLVLEEAGELYINELVQDELLLAMSVAPSHDIASCEAADTIKEINEAGKINPFAVLESLKNKSN